MSDELQLLDQTLHAIFTKHFDRDARIAAGQDLPRNLWAVLESSGLTTLGDIDNGAGLAELIVLARAVGRAAVPVPLVETAGLAAWLVTSSGLRLPAGITTCAATHPNDNLEAVQSGNSWVVSGVLHRVPYGRDADYVTALADGADPTVVVVLPVHDVTQRSTNLGGEPRDTLQFDGVVLPSNAVGVGAVDHAAMRRRGALLRSASMAGAMDSVLDMSLAYADEREQFGKVIASFQAVQHHLAAIAEEAMCAGMAVQLAAAATTDQEGFAIAAAKSTAGSSARVVTKRAHQVHAAIGVTQEHSLPWFTKRLWAWQDEFGTTQHWASQLGREVIAGGGANLWPTISETVGTHAEDRSGARDLV